MAHHLSGGQIALLDATRGVASHVVCVGHVFVANKIEMVRYWPDLGVVAFLVISGFLITLSAHRKGPDYGFIAFIIDRGSRIYSAYLPCLLFIVACGLVFRLPGPIDLWHVITNLLLLQNMPVPKFIAWREIFEPIGTGRQLWTLSVEWWFYWAFGAVFFLKRAGRYRWLLLVVGIPGFLVVIRQSAYWVLAYPWIVGSLGAFYVVHKPRPTIAHVFLACALFGLAVTRYVNHSDFYDLQGVLLVSALLICALVMAAPRGCPAPVAKVARFFAEYSFSLFLLNSTVIAVLVSLEVPLARSTFVMLIACNTVALANYYLAERHYRGVAASLHGLWALRGK